MGPTDFISSLSFAESQFPSHGEFRVHVEGDVICWRNRGPFNLEAQKSYVPTRIAAYQRFALEGRRMAVQVEWLESALMSPDALQLYQQGFEAFFAKRTALVAIAWVGSGEVEGVDFMFDLFAPLFVRHAVPFKAFAELPEAQAWLRQQLDALPSPCASPRSP